MKELVVISGKGGTGKTSLVASFAALAERAVLVDCDVDAADLHLVLSPEPQRVEPFSGGKRARVIAGKCTGCGRCLEVCRFDAVRTPSAGSVDAKASAAMACAEATYAIDPIACEGCGVCAWFCPAGAVEFAPAINGQWYVSETRCGPMVHAELGIAEENSGKLVSTVRQAARELADQRGRGLVLVDGSPGVGCPVIASITGADLVLIVTEPTLSGLHDLERVAGLTRHFGIPAAVAVNKWDLNAEMTDRIEASSAEWGLALAGRVRYDRAVTDAQVQRLSVVELPGAASAPEVRGVWQAIHARLTQPPAK